MIRLFLLSREDPVDMVDIECGELIEEEVEEIWWLGNSEGRMEMGKVMLLFITAACIPLSICTSECLWCNLFS